MVSDCVLAESIPGCASPSTQSTAHPGMVLHMVGLNVDRQVLFSLGHMQAVFALELVSTMGHDFGLDYSVQFFIS